MLNVKQLTGVGLIFFLSACATVPEQTTAPTSPQKNQQPKKVQPSSSGRDTLKSGASARAAFSQVVARVEPVAERECRKRTKGVNCDFRIVIDPNPRAPSNAYQSLDKNGRPLITFTQKLLDDAYNIDELAFVLGHEAAHHISGHLARKQQNAMAGAVIFAGLATLSGATGASVSEIGKLGAQVGARSYSKEYELEADSLGTVITHYAGYSPVRGAAFFTRIPDPGDRFLGSHPPNAQRIHTVRKTMNAL